MTKSQDRLKDVVWCGKTACPCVRFSHVSEPGDPEAAATMYLIVGPTRGGKTLLLKRLMLHATTRDVGDGDVPPTVPTVGTNLVNVSLGKKSEITVRELGGSMAPIWHNYYRDCRHLMFAIGLSDRARVAAACVQLTDALSSPELPRGARVLIVMNKRDTACMSARELAALIMLDDVRRHAGRRVDVVQTSARTGDGVGDVVRWLQDSLLQEKTEQASV